MKVSTERLRVRRMSRTPVGTWKRPIMAMARAPRGRSRSKAGVEAGNLPW